VDRALRLVSTNLSDSLAQTIEALLVIASAPLTVEALAHAADEDPQAIESALELLIDRYREGRSGIVLEYVAGGWAFRASAQAAAACARLQERPAERGLSQPEIARIRGVNVDGVVAGLVERGLIAEAGREEEFGAVRYRTTPLFERVFGLESLSALPRVDDLGADVTEIRARLEAVAEKRPA